MAKTLSYRAEYARSERSTCCTCDNVILKSELRLAHVFKPQNCDYSQKQWHHFDCFFENNFDFNDEEFDHFEHLRVEDQKRLEKAVEDAKSRSSNSAEKGTKSKGVELKRKADTEQDCALKLKMLKTIDSTLKPAQTAIESEKLKEQSDEKFMLIEKLKHFKRKELLQLFEENKITFFPDDVNERYEVLSDALTFGCPKKCPKCDCSLSFKVSRYVCTGYLNEWEKCDYETETPQRQAFVIPEDLKLCNNFWKSYNVKTGKRVIDSKLKYNLQQSKNQQLDQLYSK